MRDLLEIRRERLALLLRECWGGAHKPLAQAARVQLAQIGQWLSEPDAIGHRNISERTARKLERVSGKPPLWLDYDGEEARLIAMEAPAEYSIPSAVKPVPLVSNVRATNFTEAFDPYAPGVADEWLMPVRRLGSAAYALRVTGESMVAPVGEKSYPPGCFIFVDPDRRSPTSGELIIAKIDGAPDVTFKKYRNEDGRQWLQPLNPSFPRIDTAFKVLGTVVGKWEDA